MKTQKSLNYITLLIASGIVVNFGLFVINVNAYFSITAKTFQGKNLTVASFFDIFCLLILKYITIRYSRRSWDDNPILDHDNLLRMQQTLTELESCSRKQENCEMKLLTRSGGFSNDDFFYSKQRCIQLVTVLLY